MAENKQKVKYILSGKDIARQKPTVDTTDLLQYGEMLKEVIISSKGRGFGDRYLGYLDSIAKYEGITDYVGTCGWLNCPVERTNTKPIEGKQYWVFNGDVTSHGNRMVLTRDNHKSIIYHYPSYTEEELLKKFKMGIVKGYYQSREFYEPDYDREKSSGPDNRNTLLWKPAIVTDSSGAATVQFFCSDIRSRFTGIIEGVSEEGMLGAGKFTFRVK